MLCLCKNYIQHNISDIRSSHGGYYEDLLSSERLSCVVWGKNIEILEEPEDEGSRFLSMSIYMYQATQASHPRRQ
jgi:hypothetical protein